MINSLRIENAAPSEYVVEILSEHSVIHVYFARSLVGAIRESVQIMPTAQAFHIWFEHVSIGTISTLQMSHYPEMLASRLKVLHKQFESEMS